MKNISFEDVGTPIYKMAATPIRDMIEIIPQPKNIIYEHFSNKIFDSFEDIL